MDFGSCARHAAVFDSYPQSYAGFKEAGLCVRPRPTAILPTFPWRAFFERRANQLNDFLFGHADPELQ